MSNLIPFVEDIPTLNTSTDVAIPQVTVLAPEVTANTTPALASTPMFTQVVKNTVLPHVAPVFEVPSYFAPQSAPTITPLIPVASVSEVSSQLAPQSIEVPLTFGLPVDVSHRTLPYTFTFDGDEDNIWTPQEDNVEYTLSQQMITVDGGDTYQVMSPNRITFDMEEPEENILPTHEFMDTVVGHDTIQARELTPNDAVIGQFKPILVTNNIPVMHHAPQMTSIGEMIDPDYLRESQGPAVVSYFNPGETQVVYPEELAYNPEETQVVYQEELQEEVLPMKEYTALTHAYVETMMKPYINVLMNAGTKEALLAWVPLVFQDSMLETIQGAINQATDIETSRNEVIRIMVAEWFTLANVRARKIITPWDLAGARDDQLTKLLGPASLTIPVMVTVGANVYTHDLSQDFMFGIMNVLADNPQFRFSIGDKPITIEDIHPNYTISEDDDKTHYIASLPRGSFAFTSPDVVQGIMTAAQWTNTDGHTFIKDFTGILQGTRRSLVF